MNTTETRQSYSGRTRRKQTAWSVRAADVIAQWCITVGGIGTIVAVSLVFVFLFAVVAPIFSSASLSNEQVGPTTVAMAAPLAFAVDEFRAIGWLVAQDGQMYAFQLDTADEILHQSLFEGAKPTNISRSLASDDVAIGASDGSIRLGTIKFATTLSSTSDALSPEAKDLAVGKRIIHKQGVVEKTSQGPWRVQQLEISIGSPVEVTKSPIRLLDHLVVSGGSTLGEKEYLFACYAEDGSCRFGKITEQENQITGEKTVESSAFDVAYRKVPDAEPFKILLTGRGDNLYLIWTNGVLQRYDVRDTNKLALIEETQLLSREEARLAACGFLLGRESLVVGDTLGGVHVWFRTRHPDDENEDGQRLTMVHDLSIGSAAVTAFRSSERGRTFVVGYADGTIRVFHATTEKRVLEKQLVRGEPLVSVAITPKEDGLVAVAKGGLWMADFDPRHPEVSMSSLFRPVWYEGYDRPMAIWQSSFSTSAPEMKLGLLPLIFGTIKATFYTMLFAAPLAMFAAIYTSEFMHPRTRGIIKPTIEMMASLPSVVLGFLAALVLAPMIERNLASVLATVYLSPFIYLASAHLWQALPPQLVVRWQKFRFMILFVPLPIGIAVGMATGPIFERVLFAGDTMRWLDGQIGSGVGAWLLLWLPLSAMITAILIATQVNPMLRGWMERCTRRQAVLMSLVKFVAASLVAVLMAGAISFVLNAIGWDPRGSFVDTYVQRNALVVGVVMGVAVIPIVYTIADDALSTVPQHLRSASVGCGATPWQTAFRVVVPTAMSGLFSALMIGLGRAVGETMIVLMAGGNTPVMEWNIFNGVRTLSANIAVELPEAVRDSTHYRTLFFSALTLFVLTFCLNTLAEVVRLRFRKRAVQL